MQEIIGFLCSENIKDYGKHEKMRHNNRSDYEKI